MKQMLNISTTDMIGNHISAADMRKTLGMKDVVHQMERLQLKWVRAVRLSEARLFLRLGSF
jgi:hypothetical protein